MTVVRFQPRPPRREADPRAEEADARPAPPPAEVPGPLPGEEVRAGSASDHAGRIDELERRVAAFAARPRALPVPEPANAPLSADPPALSAPRETSRESRRGLDLFAFFVANLQTGFGPFVAVYFTAQRWTQVDIGVVLTVGGLVGLFGQVPGGALVDLVRRKRLVAGLSVGAIGASALMLALSPTFPVVLLAMLVHAAASCTLSPAIASMSLGLAGHAGIGERLGRNASFSSIGAALAAAGMGACGYYLSHEAVFYVTAALAIPALGALSFIGASEVRRGLARAAAPEMVGRGALAGLRDLLRSRALLALSGCIALFFLANGALLPLVGSYLTVRTGHTAAVLIAACIVVPQIVMALIATRVGRAAQRWGRRPLLLIGFATLPLRGLLFALNGVPELVVAVQVLDGLSAAVLGVAVPLVVADATRRTGHFNLALGITGTATGLGAALSTTLSGLIADRLGTQAAFLGLSGVALAGLAILALVMPETGPRTRPGTRLPETTRAG